MQFPDELEALRDDQEANGPIDTGGRRTRGVKIDFSQVSPGKLEDADEDDEDDDDAPVEGSKGEGSSSPKKPASKGPSGSTSKA